MADGTFAVVPSLGFSKKKYQFKQMFTLQFVVDCGKADHVNILVTGIWILLSGKKETQYVKALELVVERTKIIYGQNLWAKLKAVNGMDNNQTRSSRVAKTDFEMGLRNAMQKILNIDIFHLCHFHYGQALTRNAGTNG